MIAATETTGITASEVTAAKAGIVAPARDPESLLSAIRDLNDKDAAARFGLNSKKYCEAILEQGVAVQRWAGVGGEIGTAQTLDTP